VFGSVLARDRVRRRLLLGSGLALTAGFIALRATNLYGDPEVWTPQSTWLATVLSFVNCTKYPASLLYLMMTLGPALLLLAAFADARGQLANWIATFGRVPLLYYVAHLFLIHLLAVVYARSVRRRVHCHRSGDAGEAPWLRSLSAGQFRGVAAGRRRPLPALPLVCSAQAAPPRMVVELPVKGLPPPGSDST
jgi:hypothetical protein